MIQCSPGVVIPFSTLDKTRVFICKDNLDPLLRRAWERPSEPLGIMEVCFVC
jgi:hypothetical protein